MYVIRSKGRDSHTISKDVLSVERLCSHGEIALESTRTLFWLDF